MCRHSVTFSTNLSSSSSEFLEPFASAAGRYDLLALLLCVLAVTSLTTSASCLE